MEWPGNCCDCRRAAIQNQFVLLHFPSSLHPISNFCVFCTFPHHFYLALLQMERQRQRQSPITQLIRNSVEKVGVVLAPEKRRVSRQILTDMNIAQLQVIVNDLHSHIEHLNESLVKFLLERDELHMGQDSMLVDIEDMTKYL